MSKHGPNILSRARDGIEHGFLHGYYNDLKSIAILLDSPSNNQLYFYTVVKNSVLQQKRGDLCVSIYLVNDEPPIIWPQTAIRNVSEFFRFRGTAVATSLSTLEVMKNNEFCNGIFYLFDITELFNVEQSKLKALMKGVTIVTRNQDYYNLATKHFKLENVRDKFMPDINFDKIIELARI